MIRGNQGVGIGKNGHFQRKSTTFYPVFAKSKALQTFFPQAAPVRHHPLGMKLKEIWLV